jgi:uncharacterized membrane protein YphA (DoxX/SURF4 family)
MKKNIQQFLFGTSLNNNKTIINIIWLLFRLHIGLSLAINAGLPKMQEGLAPDWFVKQVGEIGFTFISPTFWATVASWGEFIGGICIAFGLLTRFSAIQLAFQFFVISFIWYDKPMPVVGMYFQQTLFWSYILVAFLGGGKYSIDYLIANRKIKSVAVPVKFVTTTLLATLLSCTAKSQPVNGSGVIVAKTFSFNNFTKLDIKDVPGKIFVEVGKPFSIETEIDGNLAELLSVTENNGELQLKFIGNRSNKMYIEETNVKIKITMPAISSVYHSANSKLVVTGVSGSNFKIKNNENGSAIIKGKVDELNITCTGNGTVFAQEMSAQKINVTKRGNGSVYINTDNTFSANGSGNGDVINKGNGKADDNSGISGNGSIQYPNQPKVIINGAAPAKFVSTLIKNETAKSIHLSVKYPNKGSYGIEVKPSDSLKERFPIGTKLYKGNQFTTFKKPIYTVTANDNQQFILNEN